MFALFHTVGSMGSFAVADFDTLPTDVVRGREAGASTRWVWSLVSVVAMLGPSSVVATEAVPLLSVRPLVFFFFGLPPFSTVLHPSPSSSLIKRICSSSERFSCSQALSDADVASVAGDAF